LAALVPCLGDSSAVVAVSTGIAWHGKDVPVRSESVKAALAGVRAALVGEGAGETLEKALEKASAALQTEKRALMKKAARNGRGARPEALRDNAELTDYLKWIRARSAAEKHAKKARHAASVCFGKSLVPPFWEQEGVKDEKYRSDDVLSEFEAAIAAVEEMHGLGTEGSKPGELSGEEEKVHAARVLGLRAERLFCVALKELNLGKCGEAEQTAVEAGKMAGDAKAHEEDCKEPIADALMRMDAVGKAVRIVRCVARAAGQKKEGEGEGERSEKSVAEEPEKRGVEPEGRQLAGAGQQLEIVAPRPTFFDAAGMRVAYPDVSGRTKKRGFFGLFG